MKSVCIVGAGPAGLVAAKTFLQTKQFAVTVYEKQGKAGGIWALDEDSTDGYLSPTTPTNLSRFTVGFSDLDWNSVDLQSRHAPSSNDPSPSAPMYPKAWQVGRYLEAYRRKHVLDQVILLGREVVDAERFGADLKRWRITTKSQDQRSEIKDFDFLLVASGFFSSPRPIEQDLTSLSDFNTAGAVTAIHSSQFRSLDNLVLGDVSGKNILLFGGGNTSGETAAAVAMQLSDAQWSPQKSEQKAYKDCKVIHVTPRPLYGIPPYNEFEPGSSTFVPLDLKLYDLSKRPTDMAQYGGQQPSEVKELVHAALQTMVGGDQSDLSDALVSPAGDSRAPVYVALSEGYSGFVRSGLIDVVAGRVTSLQSKDNHLASASIKTADGEITLDNLAAIIYATGYTPGTALQFLPGDVKMALDFDPTSMRLPLILEQWQTFNDAVPELGFLGFYEGPYWPMIEMQARLISSRWLDGSAAPPNPFETRTKLLQLRQAMHDRALDVPQYWFGDYVGYLQDMATHLSLAHNHGPFADREGCTSPARHLAPHDDHVHSKAIMHDLHRVWHDCTQSGKYVPRATFRALQGHWTITRSIKSADAAFSGTLTGTASFHPRVPTPDPSGVLFDLEYLYIESGTFRSAATGLEKLVTHRQVYRYSERDDRMSVWFVQPDKLDADHLLYELAFARTPSSTEGGGGWTATADHLSVDDMDRTEYELQFTAINLPRFTKRQTSKGQQNDHVVTTEYQRAPRGS